MAVKISPSLSNVRIDALRLSVRSEHALKSRQIETFGQLVQLSDKALLDIRALGAKSLAEIRETVAAVLSSHGVEAKSLEEALQSAGSQLENLSPGGWELPLHEEGSLDSFVDLLDLSVRSAKVLKRLRILTVRQLVNYSKRDLAKARNMGRKSMAEITSKLLAHLSETNPNAESSVDLVQAQGVKEFVGKILEPLPDRQRMVIADRYGLWDGISETLQDVGDKLGLTRERIRQIEAAGLKRIRRLNAHGRIMQFVLDNVHFEIEANRATRFGVVTTEEAVIAAAPDCNVEEAGLAMRFLQDIQGIDKEVFADLIRIENNVYCIDKNTAKNYLELLRLLESALRVREKPLTMSLLIKDLKAQCGEDLTQDRSDFAQRVVSVSPAFVRLRNGTIGLSQWTEFGGRNAPALAEAALRLLGRPAHFKEITEKANSIVDETRALTDGTIHNALIQDGGKFIWTKNGTFGLAAWGLKRPPYIKDRLVEVLSIAGYPLPLWHLEQKVLEVCNCKPMSVRMTLDLNPQTFSKFAGDQYGLQEHGARPEA